MRVYFNIGLDLPSGGSLDESQTAEILQSDGYTVHRVAQSATEKTVVCSVNYDGPVSTHVAAMGAAVLAWTFQQDAVAWYCPDHDVGGLQGPKAQKWGPFNRSLFLMP